MLKLAGEDGTATLSCDKQKDGAPPFEPTELRLVPTEDGTTCTVRLATQASGEAALTTKARAVLAALEANFLEEGATATEWMKVCAVPDSTFYGARKQLLVGEYVAKVGRRYVVQDKGYVLLEEYQVSGLTPTPKKLQSNSNGVGSHFNSNTPHPLKGAEVGSGETETAETTPADDDDAPLLGREQAALVTLDEVFGPRGATDAQWRDACIERGQARASYYRAKPVLLARGLVVVEGTGPGARYWLAHERSGPGLTRSQSQQVSPPGGLTETSKSETSGETTPDQEGGLPW
jgi:hypothetical protein